MAAAAPLSSACTEVLEALLLFMNVQHGNFSRASMKQLKQELSLSLTAEETHCTVQGFIIHTIIASHPMPVSAGGLGAYYLDGKPFLQTLCEHGQQLKRTLSSSTLRLFCRRIGEYENIVSFEILEVPILDGGPMEIRESLVPRPRDFPPAGLVITFTVPISYEVLYSEVGKLSAQVHLLHLVNPEVYFSLRVKGHNGAVSSLQYEKEAHRPITNSPFKMITALQHYMEPDSVPARQSRLYLLRSHTFTIPHFTLRDGESISLKIYCSVAVVPHLPLRNGRKIPADRLCRSLHISVFGPGNLPVILAGSQASFPLANLANWENYGLSIGQPIPAKYQHISQSSDQCQVVQSLTYELGSKRRAPRLEGKHFLQLFIFLEEGGRSRRSAADNDQWRQLFGLVHELRGRFDSLVMSYSKKFQQTTHSALNKLICNYGSYTKTSSVMGNAIPLISEAVASILQHSTNGEFKRKCRRLAQAESDEDVERAVSQRLWRIAREKLQISHPSETVTHVPDEPTSPEIIQADSEADQEKTKSRKKRTPIANSDDGKTDGDVQREVPEASQEETQISDPDSGPVEFNSQSLIQARMMSQRKKGDHRLQASQTTEGMHKSGQCPALTGMHPEDSEITANSTAIVSDDSFEALTSVDECMREDTQCSTTKDSLMEEEYSEPLLVTGSLWKPPSTPIQEDSLACQSATSQSATDICSETQCSAGLDDSFEALTSVDECGGEDTQHCTTMNMTDSQMEECSEPLLVTGKSLRSNMKPPSTPIQEDSLASQSAISQSASGVLEIQCSADSFEALTSAAECVREDTQHSTNLTDSQMEEYSEPLLVTRILWSNMKPQSTPIQEDSLASQSAISQSASGFDDLETVEVEDEFNSVPLGCGDTTRDDAVEGMADCCSEFDELEHVSVYNSITDGSFTDSEMDLSGFSVDSKENNKSPQSDRAAVVPNVDPEVESTDITMISGRHDMSCASDSEWNDVALGPVESTPVCQVGPHTPLNTMVSGRQDIMSCASDSEWNDVALGPVESTPVCQVGPHTPPNTYPSESFDCLEDVSESSTEGALQHHLPPTVGVCTTEDHSDNLHDSLGSSDLEWEEDIALLPQRVCGTKTTSVQEDTSWPVRGLESQAPRVPDVMNQSLTCDITENDFHWD